MTRQYITDIGKKARASSQQLALMDSAKKNAVLHALAKSLNGHREAIKSANAKDCQAAKQKGLSEAMIDRLVLNDERIDGMITGVNQVIALPDPIGALDDMRTQASGIKVGKMRIPIGVIGMIYESRPNVTIDAAILCFKSGNAVILRGGSEALHSNMALVACMHEALQSQQVNLDVVQFIENTDREVVSGMLTLTEYIDVIIPRGGKGLTSVIDKESKVPVIKHLDGICHVYIDANADVDKAIAIAINAKTRRYGVCGSMETLLVHSGVAEIILPLLAENFAPHAVELRVCSRAQKYLNDYATVAATDEDWITEYLAPILSIKVVNGIDDAITHINDFGSHHTDAIVTENITLAQQFIQAVDSSSVVVNASTQFADGFEYGLGAEIGISTNKLHVRGPVGLEGLTTQKYVVMGNGHTRA